MERLVTGPDDWNFIQLAEWQVTQHATWLFQELMNDEGKTVDEIRQFSKTDDAISRIKSVIIADTKSSTMYEVMYDETDVPEVYARLVLTRFVILIDQVALDESMVKILRREASYSEMAENEFYQRNMAGIFDYDDVDFEECFVVRK